MARDSMASKLMGVVARVESRGAAGSCHGTGFIYEVPLGGGGTRTFLVSNRHQFDHAGTQLRIRVLRRGLQGAPAWGQQLELDVPAAVTRWVPHPDSTVDVGVLPLDGIVSASERLFAVSSHVAMSAGLEQEFDAVEPILTVGFPNGMFDSDNLTPITRSGVTATPLWLDYGGEPAFCIDAATLQGSSGSPVFVLVPDSASTAASGFQILGSRAVLAGVVSAVFEREVIGDIRRVKAAEGLSLSINDALHLGFVIKARAIDDCVDVALTQRHLQRAPDGRASGRTSGSLRSRPPGASDTGT